MSPFEHADPDEKSARRKLYSGPLSGVAASSPNRYLDPDPQGPEILAETTTDNVPQRVLWQKRRLRATAHEEELVLNIIGLNLPVSYRVGTSAAS